MQRSCGGWKNEFGYIQTKGLQLFFSVSFSLLQILLLNVFKYIFIFWICTLIKYEILCAFSRVPFFYHFYCYCLTKSIREVCKRVSGTYVSAWTDSAVKIPKRIMAALFLKAPDAEQMEEGYESTDLRITQLIINTAAVGDHQMNQKVQRKMRGRKKHILELLQTKGSKVLCL